MQLMLGLALVASSTTAAAAGGTAAPPTPTPPASAPPPPPPPPVYPCFVERRFEEDQVQVFYDIEYGSAWNNLTESEQTLTLDAYLPPGGPVPGAAATLPRPARRGGC